MPNQGCFGGPSRAGTTARRSRTSRSATRWPRRIHPNHAHCRHGDAFAFSIHCTRNSSSSPPRRTKISWYVCLMYIFQFCVEHLLKTG